MPQKTVSLDEVAELADLACLALTDEEIAQLAADLTDITNVIDKVAAAVPGDTPQTGHPIPLVNVWRPDVVGQTLDRTELLSQAPASQDGLFEVPRMLEEEQ